MANPTRPKFDKSGDAGNFVWLAIYGSPRCIYIVQLWSMAFLCLCRTLGASPFTLAARIACPVQRLRSAWQLQMFRDSLQSGDVAFTNRQPLLPWHAKDMNQLNPIDGCARLCELAHWSLDAKVGQSETWVVKCLLRSSELLAVPFPWWNCLATGTLEAKGALGLK